MIKQSSTWNMSRRRMLQAVAAAAGCALLPGATAFAGEPWKGSREEEDFLDDLLGVLDGQAKAGNIAQQGSAETVEEVHHLLLRSRDFEFEGHRGFWRSRCPLKGNRRFCRSQTHGFESFV